MNHNFIGPNWEEVEAELFTPEEIAESRARVEILAALIFARREQGISQKKLEKLSGIKQPVIARTERGTSNPRLDTVLKLLTSLGKTLAVVPLDKTRCGTHRAAQPE